MQNYNSVAEKKKINKSSGVKSCLAVACSWWLTQTVRGSTPSPPAKGRKKEEGGGGKDLTFAIHSLVNLDDNG